MPVFELTVVTRHVSPPLLPAPILFGVSGRFAKRLSDEWSTRAWHQTHGTLFASVRRQLGARQYHWVSEGDGVSQALIIV